MEEYLVKEHDTLWKIARKHKTTVDVLASLNKLKGRQIHQLRVDQKLYLPGDDSSTPIGILLAAGPPPHAWGR